MDGRTYAVLIPSPDRRKAAILSMVLPGLGQLYLGERAKALGVICAAVGMLFGIAMAIWGPPVLQSVTTVVLLSFTYLFVLFPAVVDAWREPIPGKLSLLEGESTGFVLFLLLMVGPLALPILWQSPTITHFAKVLLTLLVIMISMITIAFLLYLGPMLEQLLPEMLEILQSA